MIMRQQIFHCRQCLSCCNKIIKNDDVSLFRQIFKGEYCVYTLTRMAYCHIFIEWYPELKGNPFAYPSSEILNQVSAFGSCAYRPIAIHSIIAQYFSNNRGHCISKEFYHCIIGFYIGKSSTIQRLLPYRYKENSTTAS